MRFGGLPQPKRVYYYYLFIIFIKEELLIINLINKNLKKII